MKNLQDLGANPFPYMVHVLSRPLPSEVVKGEHFVLSDLLKLFPGGFSQEKAAPETLVRLDHLPLPMQDPKPVPQEAKKNKKKKKIGQAKAAGTGLEGFVDWTNL